MLLPEKEQYEIDVYVAFSKSNLEIVSIIPEKDYIEVLCPHCHKIEIFRYNEIKSARCSSCYKKKSKKLFEDIALKKAESAEFEVTFLDYDEDYIEVECFSCNYTTSVRFQSLANLYCPRCTAKKIGSKYQVEIYFDDEGDSEELATQEHEVTMLCQECWEYSWKRKLSDLTNTADSKLFQCNLCFARSKIYEYGFVEDYPQDNSEFDAHKFPVTCRRCGCTKYLDLEAPDLEQQLQSLKCIDGCETDGIRERTDSGSIIWCKDELDLFAVYNLARINELVDIELNIPDTSDRDIYLGWDTTTYDYCHVFVVFNGNYDIWKSKYLFFSMHTHAFIPNGKLNVDVVRHWPYYYKELLESIGNQFTQRSTGHPDAKYLALMNLYLEMISLFMFSSNSIRQSLIEIRQLRRKLNNKLAEKGVYKKVDPWFLIYEEKYHCPICGYPHRRNTRICTACGFSGLQKITSE